MGGGGAQNEVGEQGLGAGGPNVDQSFKHSFHGGGQWGGQW